MNNTRLIKVLKTFSPEEIKEFDKFLNSPYFGCRKFIVNFFRVLKKYHPEFREKDVEKKKLFRKIYPDKKYNDGLLRRMTSEINHFAEEYLMQKRLYMTSAFRNNCLLMELRDRDLGNLFEQKAKNILKNLKEEKVTDFYTLLDKHLTEIELNNEMTQRHDKSRFNKLGDALESLITFYLNSYLSSSNNLLNSGITINSEITNSFIGSFDLNKFFEGLKKADAPAANLLKAIHYSNSILSDKSDIQSYTGLRKILKSGYESISSQQRYIFYAKLFHFYSYYNSMNDETYLKDQYEDYRTAIKEKLFLSISSIISVTLCRNYVNTCRALSKTEEINSFLKNYSDYFDPLYKDDLIPYCNSQYFFEKKEFEKSLELLSRIKIDLPVFKNDIRIFKLRNLYELSYTESFYSELDSYNHFLRNTDLLNKENLKSSKNFAGLIAKLMKQKISPDSSQLNILKKEIKAQSFIHEKKWLLAKA